MSNLNYIGDCASLHSAEDIEELGRMKAAAVGRTEEKRCLLQELYAVKVDPVFASRVLDALGIKWDRRCLAQGEETKARNLARASGGSRRKARMVG